MKNYWLYLYYEVICLKCVYNLNFDFSEDSSHGSDNLLNFYICFIKDFSFFFIYIKLIHFHICLIENVGPAHTSIHIKKLLSFNNSTLQFSLKLLPSFTKKVKFCSPFLWSHSEETIYF